MLDNISAITDVLSKQIYDGESSVKQSQFVGEKPLIQNDSLVWANKERYVGSNLQRAQYLEVDCVSRRHSCVLRFFCVWLSIGLLLAIYHIMKYKMFTINVLIL